MDRVTPQPEPAPAVDAAQGVGLEEALLIRAAQRGDQEAFERLVRIYDRSVLRLALNLLRSAEDAQEVYQETFLRVYRNLHSFRSDSNFSTWLYRIVTNVCVDYLRKRKVRREEPAMVDTAEGMRDRLESLPEPAPYSNPQRALENQHLRIGLERALESLTPRERMVFELRHYQGLRLKKIAELLDSTEEAVKTCLFRATQKMRAALKDYL